MFESDNLVLHNHQPIIECLASRAAAGHVDMVRYFLGRISPNDERAGRNAGTLIGARCCRPLVSAVANGNEEVVRLLLEHDADPNWFSRMETPLMVAARKRAVTIARILLDAGADVNDGCPPPIVLAVWKEDREMYDLLRKYGANINSHTGGWAMAIAKREGLESMVQLLVQEGMNEDMVLSRVPEEREVYHFTYLFPYYCWPIQ
jgi:hypothetical protein